MERTLQRVMEAILAAESVFPDPEWRAWAESWKRADDRSEASADKAARTAKASIGEASEIDTAERALETAAELAESGLDPELSMDIADEQYERELVENQPAIPADSRASSIQHAAVAAQFAAEAARAAAVGLEAEALRVAELALQSAVLAGTGGSEPGEQEGEDQS